MRILFCNYEYPPLGGGGGVVMAALARQLARRHEVTVLTSRAGELAAEADDQGVRVVRVPVFFRRQLAVANFPSMLAYLPSGFVRGLSLRAAPGSTSSTRTSSCRPGRSVTRSRAGIGCRTCCRCTAAICSIRASAARRIGMRRCAPPCARCSQRPTRSSASRATRSGTSARSTACSRDVGLIPLGIERPPARVARVARRPSACRDDAFVMVTIGRLVARKATTQLVDVLAASAIPERAPADRRRRPGCRGDPRSARRELGVAIACTCSARSATRTSTPRSPIADAFVSTSQHEGFGLVFLEAMAFGLPVVCYDRGGQTDFLTSGETGFVVQAQRRRRVRRRGARNCMPTSQLRARASASATGSWSRTTSSTRCAARYEKVFEAAIGRAASARANAAWPS